MINGFCLNLDNHKVVNLSMDFSKIISSKRIVIGKEADEITNKEQLFLKLADTFLQTNVIQSKTEFIQSLNYRETLGSTFMGNFIAIPHGESDKILNSSLAICKLNTPIDYESHGENGSVKYIFMFAIEKSTAGTNYLRMLADLSRLLLKEHVLSGIESATNEKDIIRVFSKEEI